MRQVHELRARPERNTPGRVRCPRAQLAVAAAALLLGMALEARSTPQSAPHMSGPNRDTDPQASVRQVQESGFAGSDACARCHPSAYGQWKQSVHLRMTSDVVDAPSPGAQLLGTFDGSHVVRGQGYRYTPRIVEGAPALVIDRVGLPPTTFPTHYTLGEKRFQGYMSRQADGGIYVLPAFWHLGWQRWIDWKEITPVPDSGEDFRQIWNVNCFNCHATNIQRNFNVETKAFSTTWTEMGVGCEACHGPGAEHIERMVAWGRNPAAYPDIDPNTVTPESSRQMAIFVPRAASPRQVFDMCSYCHGNKTNHFVDFRPGDRLEDFAQLALPSDPRPAFDRQGDYWPDGRPSRFNRPQALAQTGCFARGGATCASCHAAHGSTNEHSLRVPLDESDRLCTQCHQWLKGGRFQATTQPSQRTSLEQSASANIASAVRPPAEEIVAHTHHAAGSPGSSCVACHMSEVNWRLLMRRRDHTFAPPVPEATARHGVPNACTTCHEDRSPEWAALTMDRWYGDRARRERTLAVANALTAAENGDVSVVPELADMAVDRRRAPALVRATAAAFIGRLEAQRGTPQPPVSNRAVNALVAAASDPEALVRVESVRALGAVEAPVATSALVARLVDTSRVVRVAAAEALLFAGVTHLPEPASSALRRAQEEYAVSLRAFGDMASHRASLGWLLAARGDVAAGEVELRHAIALDPRDARPHVYLGVLRARVEEWDGALEHWNTARTLAPTYPRLDEMMAAARQRRDDKERRP